MHAHPSPRGRPCHAACLSAAAPAPLAATVWAFLQALSQALSAQPPQSAFRPASPALVRAKPSGRGFRRDFRGLAHAAIQLAQALCRLARAEEAGICRRADGGDRRAEAFADSAVGGGPASAADPYPCPTLREEAGSLSQ